MDSCQRRRNRLETCLKKQRNVDKNKHCFSAATAVELAKKTLHRARFFETYSYARSMEEQ